MPDDHASNQTGRVHLNGYLDVPADRWDTVSTALPDHVALTRNEPGCIKFNVIPCREVELRLLVDETFQDQASFDAHQARTKDSPWAEITAGIPREYTITVDT